MRFVSTVVILPILFLVCGCNPSLQRDAHEIQIEYVQVTSMRLDAGTQTIEAFRVLKNGTIEWARWDSNGNLLGHMKPHGAYGGLYERILSSMHSIDSLKQSSDTGVLGRPAYRLEIASLSASGTTLVGTTMPSEDMTLLIEEMKQDVQESVIEPGWYIWTEPSIPSGTADVDLNKDNASSSVHSHLQEAVATGRLIVLADDSIQTFVTGERAFRTTFEAKVQKGALHFGVLRS